MRAIRRFAAVVPTASAAAGPSAQDAPRLVASLDATGAVHRACTDGA